MALSHLEVLPEVLVAAPPVGPDHVQALVAADLMEVGVAHVVLLAVDGEAAISVGGTVGLVGLTQSVAPVLDHALLLVLDHDPEEERGVEVEDQENPDETDAVLLVEGLYFPVEVAEGVLEESSNILEGSPLLCHITRLSSGGDEFSEVTISLLSKSSIRILYLKSLLIED